MSRYHVLQMARSWTCSAGATGPGSLAGAFAAGVAAALPEGLAQGLAAPLGEGKGVAPSQCVTARGVQPFWGL